MLYSGFFSVYLNWMSWANLCNNFFKSTSSVQMLQNFNLIQAAIINMMILLFMKLEFYVWYTDSLFYFLKWNISMKIFIDSFIRLGTISKYNNGIFPVLLIDFLFDFPELYHNVTNPFWQITHFTLMLCDDNVSIK